MEAKSFLTIASISLGLFSATAANAASVTPTPTVIPYVVGNTPATSSMVNLTSQGSTDWAVFNTTSASFVDKYNGSTNVGDISNVVGGQGTAATLSALYSYTDGYTVAGPNPQSISTSTSGAGTPQNYALVGYAQSVTGTGPSFTVNLPAGTTSAMLTVYNALSEDTPDNGGTGTSTLTLTDALSQFSASTSTLAIGAVGDDAKHSVGDTQFAITGLSGAADNLTITDNLTVAFSGGGASGGNIGIDFATLSTSTPEPASLGILFVGSLGLLARQRRRQVGM